MFKKSPVLHSFSVNDISAARRFYGETLGLEVEDALMGNLQITFGDGSQAFAYEKDNHEPATFTILNFITEDVESTVDQLNESGVATKIYADDELPGMGPTDAKGILRGDDNNPQMAWFKDPAGNVIAVLTNDQDS
jgi:predicted enzyme related to lactoylglutathione lyase